MHSIAHILACLKEFTPGGARVLDAGCGDGQLLRALRAQGYDAYGYDVDEFHLQGEAWHESERVRIISETDEWPFADLDVVVSNQVLEHVHDHDFFFANHARVLREGGRGLHVFPVREVLWEAHLNIPLAHKFRDFDRMHRYIRAASRMRIGKYPGVNFDAWCEGHADYIWRLTNYKTLKEILTLARKHGLRASLRYTPAFYTRRLGWKRVFKGSAWPWKYISSITLALEKKRSY